MWLSWPHETRNRSLMPIDRGADAVEVPVEPLRPFDDPQVPMELAEGQGVALCDSGRGMPSGLMGCSSWK
jgi:hypothetical protein